MTRTDPQTAPKQGRGSAWNLARHLMDQIDAGKYQSGARLPSYRALMLEHEVNTGVVSYAMSVLSEQGYIERRHGSGVYVRSFRSRDSHPTKQSGLFALVVPDIESGLYLSIQAGMESAAQLHREQLITMTTGGTTARQADALLQLVDRDVAGIALVPCYDPLHGYQLRHLQKANVPLVLLHRGVPEVRAPLIDIPFTEVGRTAGRAIGQVGHKIAGACFGIRSPIADLYNDGYRQGLREFGAELDDRWVSWSDTPLTSPDDYSLHAVAVEQLLLQMLSQPDRPTAIFVSFDRLAVMLYLAAVQKGVRVPEDLSIVGFGGDRRSGPILPRLATVAVDEYKTGQQAYDLLAAMRCGGRPLESDESFTMTVSFDPAETLGPPKS